MLEVFSPREINEAVLVRDALVDMRQMQDGESGDIRVVTAADGKVRGQDQSHSRQCH